MVIMNILTQGVASLALGYVVLGFQPARRATNCLGYFLIITYRQKIRK